jgi:hypothetical protein
VRESVRRSVRESVRGGIRISMHVNVNVCTMVILKTENPDIIFLLYVKFFLEMA